MQTDNPFDGRGIAAELPSLQRLLGMEEEAIQHFVESRAPWDYSDVVAHIASKLDGQGGATARWVERMLEQHYDALNGVGG